MRRAPDGSLHALTAAFLSGASIGYENGPRGVVVGTRRLERAAANETVAQRTQTILKGSLVRVGLALSAVAAVSLIPRLAALV